MKNTKLVWRLSTRPTVDEVLKLVDKKLLTNEEAKEIIFSSETEEVKDLKSLDAEIKYLKEIIMALATRSQIVETIKYIEKPYYQQWPWYNGTVTYLCGDSTAR